MVYRHLRKGDFKTDGAVGHYPPGQGDMGTEGPLFYGIPRLPQPLPQPAGQGQAHALIEQISVDAGTIILATPKENDDIKYIVYLNEDGYWYYLEYSEVTYVASNDPDSNVTVRTEEEFLEKIGGSNHYIWDRVEPTIALNTKFMIEPLPNKVLSGHTYLDMRETSQEEKDAMAAAIEAERERLGENVTSVISDPGPEMFIYEPVETETAGESITAETEQPQTEEISSASSQPVSSQPTETVEDTSVAAPVIAESPENTGGGMVWVILLCGGGVVVIASVVVILLLHKRKKQTHIEADK